MQIVKLPVKISFILIQFGNSSKYSKQIQDGFGELFYSSSQFVSIVYWDPRPLDIYLKVKVFQYMFKFLCF